MLKIVKQYILIFKMNPHVYKYWNKSFLYANSIFPEYNTFILKMHIVGIPK